MNNSTQIITCKNLDVLASLEYHTQEKHSAYLPFNVLFIIKKGKLHLEQEHTEYAFGKQQFVLVKRYTKGNYFKSYSPEEGCAQMYAIAFHDVLIRDVISTIGSPRQSLPEEADIPPIQEIIIDEKDIRIEDFLDEVFYGSGKTSAKEIQDKIKSLLSNILGTNPNILRIFKKVSLPVKADLKAFMPYHYKKGYSIQELAKITGRSQATFYRDFHKAFSMPPHKWITQQRLSEAKELLEKGEKSISQIYLELGYKDLSHFSKVFKKAFGVPPSKYPK